MDSCLCASVLEEPLGWKTVLVRSTKESWKPPDWCQGKPCRFKPLALLSRSSCPCWWELGEARDNPAADEHQRKRSSQLFCQVFATGIDLSFSAEGCEPARGAVTSGVALAPALGGSQAAFLPLVNELSPCP